MLRWLAVALLIVSTSPDVAQAQVVRITVAPPAPRVEARPVAPSPRHLWVPGHWGWRGGRHDWVVGRYVVPPAAGRTWVEARWANEGGQWVFYDGHWAPGVVVVQPAPAVVVQPAPPPRAVIVQPAPPPRVVVVQPAPPPRAVVVQPAPPPPVVVHPGRGPGWKGKGKGWHGKGKGWKGRGW